MSLAAWMPSSFRFFSICLLRAMAARSSADEAQPMAIARTAWLATRGSAVPLACSRPVVARRWRRARARSRTRARVRVVRAPAPRHHEISTRSRAGSRLTGRWRELNECRRGVGPRTNDGARSNHAPHALRTLRRRLRLRLARRAPATQRLPN